MCVCAGYGGGDYRYQDYMRGGDYGMAMGGAYGGMGASAYGDRAAAAAAAASYGYGSPSAYSRYPA